MGKQKTEQTSEFELGDTVMSLVFCLEEDKYKGMLFF